MFCFCFLFYPSSSSFSFVQPFQILSSSLPSFYPAPPSLFLLLPLFFLFPCSSPPIFHFAALLFVIQSACGLTEMWGSDEGCQTVSTYLFTNTHTQARTLSMQQRAGKTGGKKKWQEHKQSIQCVHITELHLNFHAFISSKYVFRACCQKRGNCLLIHRLDSLDIIIGKVCGEINKL